jgi:hypothetical protein
MGIKLFPGSSENLHILMRLPTPEIFSVVNFSKTHASGNWSVPITSVDVVTNMSPEMDASRGDRRALRRLCFDLKITWLIAGERCTESNSGEKFKSYTDNRPYVLLSVCREPNELTKTQLILIFLIHLKYISTYFRVL